MRKWNGTAGTPRTSTLESTPYFRYKPRKANKEEVYMSWIVINVVKGRNKNRLEKGFDEAIWKKGEAFKIMTAL